MKKNKRNKKKNRQEKRKWPGVLLALALLFFVPAMTGFLQTVLEIQKEPEPGNNLPAFRKFDIAGNHLEQTYEWGEKEYRSLAVSFLYYDGKIKKTDSLCSPFSWYGMLVPETQTKEYEEMFAAVLADGKVFPVPEDVKNGQTVTYEDSWGGERNYGGERHHEGTDLMPTTEESGYFPVVSASDGVVEKKGWLNLGGYRLGVRAPHGAYYYYAHLERYADGIEEGTEVKAGDVIGYMGDTGYGEEGTTGKFDVHLHFGIYIRLAEQEVSVNPYGILRGLEKRKVKWE